MRSWTAALALAPMVMGIACSGGDAVLDAGGGRADTGARPSGDSGVAANDDGGSIADAGVDLDAGPTPDAGQAEDAGFPDSGDPGGCTYPAGATEPMAMGEVLTPYSWPTAFRGDVATQLDLTQAHCNTDPDIDWSPFDVLMFISIPAW